MVAKPANHWVRCVSTGGGNLRGIAIRATDLVTEAVRLHGLKGQDAKFLGETLMGSLLLASITQGNERVNLNIQSRGRVAQALADAYPSGEVRGYIVTREAPAGASLADPVALAGRPAANLSPSTKPAPSDDADEQEPDLPPGTLVIDLDDVVGGDADAPQGPWDEGLMSVLRTQDAEGQRPYIGTVPLVTGHLAKDLTFYWHQSEQVPSAVGLCVNLDASGGVASAGAFLIQAFPGAAPTEIAAIEQHLGEIDSLAERIAADADPLRLLSLIFQSTSFMVLEEKELKWACRCSQERAHRALALVGAEELRDMLKKDRQAEIKCDFCTHAYVFDAAELERLIDLAAGVQEGNS